MPRKRPCPRRRAVAVLLTASSLVATAACGSGLSHDEVVSASRSDIEAGAVDTGSAGSTGSTGTTGTTGTTGAPGASGTVGTTGSTTGSAGGTGAGAAGSASTTGAAATPGTTGGTGSTTSGSVAPGSGTSGGTTGSTTAGAAPVGGDTSPLTIAVVGAFSGPAGVVQKPAQVGMQVWAAAVNAQGGIAGHPVKLLTADDQGDPARYRQIIQDMVENKKVIAFVGNGTSQTVQAGKTYLDGKKVPVIGVGDGSPEWTTSPMHFSVAGAADALLLGNFSYVKGLGKKKLAVLACIEASSCTNQVRSAPKYAARAGLQLAYTANVSITQADFTAECLNAQSAGADAMYVASDGNTFYRIARSCAAQGYKPLFMSPSPSDTDASKSDLPGVVGATFVFPFGGVAGNAASAAYTSALSRYAPDEPKSQFLAGGWASGKTFEAAVLKGIGGKKPSSALLLEGLYGLKRGEQLGGLVAGLDFRRGKPNGQSFCYFLNVVVGKKWTAPKGMTAQCSAP